MSFTAAPSSGWLLGWVKVLVLVLAAVKGPLATLTVMSRFHSPSVFATARTNPWNLVLSKMVRYEGRRGEGRQGEMVTEKGGDRLGRIRGKELGVEGDEGEREDGRNSHHPDQTTTHSERHTLAPTKVL